MRKFVPTPEAVQLLLEGQLALSQVEAEGCRIDKTYLEHALDDTARKIREHEDEMRGHPDFKLWRRRFGSDTSFTVNKQLGEVVFGDLGFKRKPKRSTGDKDSDEEGQFEGIDHPLVKHYFAAQKLRKGRGTYLLGIQREMVQHADGCWYVHPAYHLNTVSTFRSSASDPSYQNLPNRNPYIAEIVRRCYIARTGQQLLEVDYGQIETRVPAFYSFDPNLIAYNSDPKKDMHRDTAVDLFFLDKDQAKEKAVRHIAKNNYVFPTFYGSYYKQTAPGMWQALTLRDVKVAGTDKTVIQHLAEHGVTELGPCDKDGQYDPEPHTFEYRVQQAEKEFWGKRFKVLAQWKRDWLEAYRREGGCRFLTGFVMVGPHAKNDITNYCIQGVAFHLTLWSLIKINRVLRRYSFRTRVIGEIHDCINFDGPPDERDDVLHLAVRVMTEDVVKHWSWINVPLVAEPEACPIDGAWFDKASLTETNGRWMPAKPDDWAKKYGEWR